MGCLLHISLREDYDVRHRKPFEKIDNILDLKENYVLSSIFSGLPNFQYKALAVRDYTIFA